MALNALWSVSFDLHTFDYGKASFNTVRMTEVVAFDPTSYYATSITLSRQEISLDKGYPFETPEMFKSFTDYKI
jgi:hypothetical protein